jgi:hypothetical protein
MAMAMAMATQVVLVGGHESDGGAALDRFAPRLPHAVALPPGRRLHDAVATSLLAGETVVVVPMTFGRDPTMVADTARTLRWIASGHHGHGRPAPVAALALAAPFGVVDHLTARLRAVAGGVRSVDPQAAVVVAARTGDPFADAELHRIAHLVRVHGAGVEVAVATVDRDADVAPTLDRLRRLGIERSVVVPAGFAPGLDVDAALPAFAGMAQAGPLMSDAAVARIVTERVGAALHDLGHGRDGIAAGLAADHGHGYAHSHPHDSSRDHHDDHDHHEPTDDRLARPPAAPGTDQLGVTRWFPESLRTTTVPTTSRSTPVAPR